MIRVIVNGIEIDPEPPPQVEGGEVRIPVRQVVQRLGAQVRMETAAACLIYDPRSGRTTIIGGARPEPGAPLLAPAERVAAAGGAHLLWDPALGIVILQRPEAALAGRRIVVDPGHGGSDTGYAGAAVAEKDCNLAVARWLHGLLRLAGARPLLTRTQDRRCNAAARLRRVADHRAVAMVAIHHNSHLDPEVRGCETYFYHSDAGQRLAHSLQAEVVASLCLPDRGVREAAFDELRHCGVPAALCKLAFLSNPEEAAMAAEPIWGLRAAVGLFRGLRCFFEHSPGA